MSSQVKYYYTSKGNRPESLEESAILIDSLNKLFVTHGVTFNFNSIIDSTYAGLKNMITNSKLESGQRYRITDYVTTTTQSGTSSAKHAFDLIVEAVSPTKLSENAYAILHDGDEYFKDSELSAWEIKYCFENDTTRFAWADTNGKGVIYYLKDEFGNACHYDFKNILFTNDNTSYYTFNYGTSDCSMNNFDGCSNDCVNNVMEAYYQGNVQYLNNIIFRQTETTGFPKNNEFDNDCYNLTIGDNCVGLDFGTDYHDKDCGSNVVIQDSNCAYVSNAGDDWKTEKVGGVAANLSKSDLDNKTVSEILDMILYPTLQPTVTLPSVSLSYSTYLVKVGTTLPTSAQLSKSNNRGSVTYINANGDKYYAGAVTNETTTDNPSGWFGTAAEEKQYSATYAVTFAAGAQLLDNKGAASTVSSYAGGTKSASITINAVYPYYVNNGSTIETMVEQSLINYYTEQTISVETKVMETTDQKFEVDLPTSITKINSCYQYNPVSGKYDITVTMVLNGTTTHTVNGVDVTYNKWVRTTDASNIQGASKYQIKIKKG